MSWKPLALAIIELEWVRVCSRPIIMRQVFATLPPISALAKKRRQLREAQARMRLLRRQGRGQNKRGRPRLTVCLRGHNLQDPANRTSNDRCRPCLVIRETRRRERERFRCAS